MHSHPHQPPPGRTMFRRQAAALLALLLPVAVSGRVIMFGDSMFSNNAVKEELEQLADHKITIENSALVGASFHDGWVPSIPAEYGYLNIKDNPPITAIIDGGGNDVMSVKDDCLAFNDRCKQQIDEALDIADKLLTRMDEDGIAHIVFMGPFYVLDLNKAVDYGYTKLDKICTKNKKVDCHLVDTRPVNPERPPDGDHIHPSPEGYKALAHAIWDVITENNIPLA